MQEPKKCWPHTLLAAPANRQPASQPQVALFPEEASTTTVTPLAARVTALVINHLGADPETVTPKSRLTRDLGCDSLDVVEIAMAIERDLGMDTMPDWELQDVKTLQELIDVVARHAPAGVPA